MAEVDTIDIPDVAAVTRTVATASKVIKSLGLPADTAWDGSAADATATQIAILKRVHIDLVTTLGAFVDGLETLIASSNTKLDSLKTSEDATTAAVVAATVATVADDAGDSGNPLKVGGRARSSEQAAKSNNDRADFITDLVGKLITLPYSNPENFVSGAITSAMTSTTSTSLIAAPASGLRNYITQITVSNSHATVGTDIIIQDGSGGTTLYTIPAAAVYGGAVITFPTPLRQPTTATALFCANVTTGASTKVSASGYKGA